MQENSLLVLTSNQIDRAEENCKSGAQAFVWGDSGGIQLGTCLRHEERPTKSKTGGPG